MNLEMSNNFIQTRWKTNITETKEVLLQSLRLIENSIRTNIIHS